MAVSQLMAAVDAAGATVRVSLPTTALDQRPTLMANDPNTGDNLYVADLPDSGGRWQWKVASGQDQVLLFTTDEGLTLPVLLNARVRRVLARELKKSGHGCGCHDELLERLRLYHALCLLLFAEGDYRSCQDHLTLLQDLEPCSCGC